MTDQDEEDDFMDAMDVMVAAFSEIKDEYGQDVAVECAGTLLASLVEALTFDKDDATWATIQ